MKKSFNYISYCIYSFMPLYFVLLIYNFGLFVKFGAWRKTGNEI